MAELSEREVHIWLCAPARVRDPELLAAYAALMSPEERAQEQRFHFERDRHTCRVTRALVRTTLSRYAGLPPDRWRFRANRYGRPELVAGQCPLDLRFNLSHTEGLVACAVTLGREVGVDVEFLPRRGETVAIADRYFSPREVQDLKVLPQDQQRERFFHYWTLKESYIKARGMGLSLPLDRFSFLLANTDPVGFAVDPSLHDDARAWQFGLWRPTSEHVLALGVRRGSAPDLTVTIRNVVPLVGDEGMR